MTSPAAVLASDINADGWIDLIVANTGGNSVSVLLGDVPPRVLSINRYVPTNQITVDTTVSYAVTFNEPVTGVDASDFSLALDNVVATTPVIVKGGGAVYTVTINGISGNGTLGLNLVDNGSIKDAAGNPLGPGGSASFQNQTTFDSGGATSVIAADVNADGKPDLVTTNSSGIGVLLGNGDGTFKPPMTFAVPATADSITLADINGDGKPDALVTRGWISQLHRLHQSPAGNGNGTFQAQQTLTAGFRSFSLLVSDVNGDGRPDLLVSP